MFEECIRGTVSEIQALYTDKKWKSELVVAIKATEIEEVKKVKGNKYRPDSN